MALNWIDEIDLNWYLGVDEDGFWDGYLGSRHERSQLRSDQQILVLENDEFAVGNFHRH